MKDKKGLIFDFDGVICDSVNIKTEAFYNMYIKYGENIAEKVKDYHLKHGGISRFEKLKYFHKNFLNISLSFDELNILCDEFSSKVFEGVISSKYISGALKFINQNRFKKKLFICTGTPQNEIELILKRKGIYDLFDDIHGSPESKSSIINNIIKNHNLEAKDLLFFGDSETDYFAAKSTKVEFIAINYDKNLLPNDTLFYENFENLIV